MINTRSICANLLKKPFTINNNNNNAIALCNTEARCWTSCTTREHDWSVEFQQQVSRRTRIAIKHIKNILYLQICHSSPHAWGYDDNMLIVPRMTQKCPALGEKWEHHLQHRGLWLLEAYWSFAQSGRSERRKDAGSGHRSGQEKYKQVQDPKKVEWGGIRKRNCCINVNYVWQKCRERDCREGTKVEMLNKRSSVEWWTETPDRMIQMVAESPTDDNGAWDFHKEQKNWNRCLLGHKNYLKGNH